MPFLRNEIESSVNSIAVWPGAQKAHCKVAPHSFDFYRRLKRVDNFSTIPLVTRSHLVNNCSNGALRV